MHYLCRKIAKQMTIANPIYDTVFKYLMEDERIARTILSALLKKDLVKVEVRPHEYANGQRDTLSVFRIDFGATVREDDGSEHLVLVELQKTWLETEALRFRQYLGVQYQKPENIVRDSKDGHAIPMVAVYLLGHKVGDIEEPVLYVRHRSYDYEGRLVTKGLPNAFVDSLTHDSIIVQIPRLHGQTNNRLEKVLSVFDQSRKSQLSQQTLDVADDFYSGDTEMEPILHRLLMAASNADMRMDMNVEDEYYSIIEKRDTEILMKSKELARQTVRLKESKAQLKESKAQLKEQKAQLKESKAQLKEQKAQLQESKAQLKEQSTQLKESKAQLQESKAQLKEQSTQLEEQSAQLKEQEQMLRTVIQMMLASGQKLEDIAVTLGKDLETLKRLTAQ